MKTSINAVIFGLSIVVAAIFLGNSYAKKYQPKGEILVTGLGNADFTSDLIVWEGRFGAENKDLKTAYENLEKQKEIVSNYLQNKGVDASLLVFSAVNTQEQNKRLYTTNGKYMGEEFLGYQLSQSVQIESKKVEMVEKISREITELLNQGVQFYSESPRYYYTQLADLKIEMISKATEDARIRAENISRFSGGNLGKLISAKMGVFQITGQNSKEEYSWGGTFNTSSKEKTASITMKLVYQTE